MKHPVPQRIQTGVGVRTCFLELHSPGGAAQLCWLVFCSLSLFSVQMWLFLAKEWLRGGHTPSNNRNQPLYSAQHVPNLWVLECCVCCEFVTSNLRFSCAVNWLAAGQRSWCVVAIAVFRQDHMHQCFYFPCFYFLTFMLARGKKGTKMFFFVPRGHFSDGKIENVRNTGKKY